MPADSPRPMTFLKRCTSEPGGLESVLSDFRSTGSSMLRQTASDIGGQTAATSPDRLRQTTSDIGPPLSPTGRRMKESTAWMRDHPMSDMTPLSAWGARPDSAPRWATLPTLGAGSKRERLRLGLAGMRGSKGELPAVT